MHTGSNSIEAIMETCHAYFNIAFESGVSWKLTSYVYVHERLVEL